MSETLYRIHVQELSPKGLRPFDPPIIWHHTVPRKDEYLYVKGDLYQVQNVMHVVDGIKTAIVDRSEITIRRA